MNGQFVEFKAAYLRKERELFDERNRKRRERKVELRRHHRERLIEKRRLQEEVKTGKKVINDDDNAMADDKQNEDVKNLPSIEILLDVKEIEIKQERINQLDNEITQLDAEIAIDVDENPLPLFNDAKGVLCDGELYPVFRRQAGKSPGLTAYLEDIWADRVQVWVQYIKNDMQFGSISYTKPLDNYSNMIFFNLGKYDQKLILSHIFLLIKELQHFLMRATVRDLLQHLLNNSQFSAFTKPVDHIALRIPDYYNVIKNPTDLLTIYTQFFLNKYENLQELADDIHLIWENCRKYNGDYHNLTITARELELAFIRELAELAIVDVDGMIAEETEAIRIKEEEKERRRILQQQRMSKDQLARLKASEERQKRKLEREQFLQEERIRREEEKRENRRARDRERHRLKAEQKKRLKAESEGSENGYSPQPILSQQNLEPSQYPIHYNNEYNINQSEGSIIPYNLNRNHSYRSSQQPTHSSYHQPVTRDHSISSSSHFSNANSLSPIGSTFPNSQSTTSTSAQPYQPTFNTSPQIIYNSNQPSASQLSYYHCTGSKSPIEHHGPQHVSSVMSNSALLPNSASHNILPRITNYSEKSNQNSAMNTHSKSDNNLPSKILPLPTRSLLYPDQFSSIAGDNKDVNHLLTNNVPSGKNTVVEDDPKTFLSLITNDTNKRPEAHLSVSQLTSINSLAPVNT